MEVNKNNFYQELANILEAISYSDAVCIDLEMSGISTSTGEEKVKMSLGDVYAKAKAAAEAFTILQLGITCVSWDDQVSGYETTTYNIPLAPSIVGDDQVSNELANKMERQITFSSQTINFLLTNHFDLAQVFERGVPYLSGAELGQLRMSRWVTDREVAYEDRINIQHLPMETQNFCRSIQHKIQEDITAKMFGEKRPKTLTLASPYGGRFSSLQKRLVNQVIDSHFCHHRASSKNGSMSMEVYPIDPRVDKNNGRILALRSQALMKLTGFGFVWNAIIGASFANKIDAEVIVGQDPEAIIALRQRLLACEARLRRKRPIIVGHNMLHDVCFLFQTFQGDLPATVREFQELVRSKLVTIVDTKYLFTRGDHEMMPDQSLEECFNVVRNEHGVSIRPKSDAFGYKTAMPHQAGYDSFMTATVFLKKVYQLCKTQQGMALIPHEDGRAVAHSDALDGPRRSSHPHVNGRSVTKSDSLIDDDDEHSLALAEKFEPLKPLTASSSAPAISGGENESESGGKIPEWKDGVFWKRYGNKVRVGVPAMLLYTGY